MYVLRKTQIRMENKTFAHSRAQSSSLKIGFYERITNFYFAFHASMLRSHIFEYTSYAMYRNKQTNSILHHNSFLLVCFARNENNIRASNVKLISLTKRKREFVLHTFVFLNCHWNDLFNYNQFN